MFSILLCSVYLCWLYGLYVPNWKFIHSNSLWSGRLSNSQNVSCHGFVTLCHWMLKCISWIFLLEFLFMLSCAHNLWFIPYSRWSQHVIWFLVTNNFLTLSSSSVMLDGLWASALYFQKITKQLFVWYITFHFLKMEL